jgi:hypothetical protein
MDLDETSPSKTLPSSGCGRGRAVGRVALRWGASLPDAAGEDRRAGRTERQLRHCRSGPWRTNWQNGLCLHALEEQTTLYNVVACKHARRCKDKRNCPISKRYCRSRGQQRHARWAGVAGFQNKSRIRLKFPPSGLMRKSWLSYAPHSKWRLKSFNQQKNRVD